jgi:hypothetical protein
MDELCLMSRALEQAIRSLRGKSFGRLTTGELAAAVVNAAEQGIRDEHALAARAIESVGFDV